MAAPLKRTNLCRGYLEAYCLSLVLLFIVQEVARAQTNSSFPPPATISFQEAESGSPVPENVAQPVPVPPTAQPANSGYQLDTINPIPVVNKEEALAAGVEILQASCINCNQGIRSPPGEYGSGAVHHKDKLFQNLCTNCGVGRCFPGQKQCHPCCAEETATGRFLCGLYDCLCCPDPCYEPKWIPIADSAFFVESARPVTQQRIRWDAGLNFILPDRSEYFWARADGNGRGPKPTAPAVAIPRLRYHDVSLYTETALKKIGVIVDMPYRSVDPDGAPHGAGFSDMNIATKTLLFDCELLQVAFQMKTFIPIGRTSKGLGVGHVSLEPSLLFAIKLHEEGYFQGQISEWIPIGGDPNYAGAILHYHFSVNQTLYRVLPDVPVIGTLEMSGFSFQNGSFTDPVLGAFQQSSGETYFYVGSGVRLFVCDRIDFGFGFQLPVTTDHFAGQHYRTEFRWRY